MTDQPNGEQIEIEEFDPNKVRQALEIIKENIAVLRKQAPAIQILHDVREQSIFSPTLHWGWVAFIHLLVQEPDLVTAALDEYLAEAAEENAVAKAAEKLAATG